MAVIDGYLAWSTNFASRNWWATTFTDPFILIDVGVIIGVAIFLVWSWSPSQRSRRRHQAARDRIEVRRKLNETTVGDQADRSEDASNG